MPLSTLTSKKRSPVVVGDLLERLRLEDAEVVDENFDVRKASAPHRSPAAAVLRSAAKGGRRCSAQSHSAFATAASTDFDVRPLTMTRAPSRTAALPRSRTRLPAVLPLTSASLPVRPRSMRGIVPG